MVFFDNIYYRILIRYREIFPEANHPEHYAVAILSLLQTLNFIFLYNLIILLLGLDIGNFKLLYQGVTFFDLPPIIAGVILIVYNSYRYYKLINEHDLVNSVPKKIVPIIRIYILVTLVLMLLVLIF